MIIDTNAYLGHWPFRKTTYTTAAELDSLAQSMDVTHMIVSSLNAIFYKDVMDGNRELAEELAAYQGKTKFLPFAIINPTYPAWEQDMKTCIHELGFCGVELTPTYHNYTLANEGIAAFKLAGELGVPVRVNCEFENIRQHSHLDPTDMPTGADFTALLEAADTTLIIGSAFPYMYGDHFVELVKARKNVFFDFVRLDDFATNSFPYVIELFGLSHLCFGSRSPLSYADPQFVKLRFSLKTDAEREAVLSENIRPYLPL